MDQETYFITEVDSEIEEKPVILNVDNGNGTHRKAISNNAEDRIASRQQLLRKIRKPLKVSIVEKRRLAKLVERETVLWDRSNPQHCNGYALTTAWKRISDLMCDYSVAECKTIWKSLRDAARYRKNKLAKSADNTDEPHDECNEYEMDPNWEFNDCMAFLLNEPTSLLKRTQRSYSMELDIRNSNDSANISTADMNAAIYCNDESSQCESNYSSNVQNKTQEDPLLVESMVNMANSIKDLVKKTTKKEERPERTPLKFDYLWGNLDKFFQKMSPMDVDELNFKFIQMAYEKVLKHQNS